MWLANGAAFGFEDRMWAQPPQKDPHGRGFRNHAQQRHHRAEAIIPRPPRNAAWVAVKVKRDKAVGPVHVELTQADGADPAHAIAGTAHSGRPELPSLLFRNRNRFPQNGGYEVEPGKTYGITVSGTDSDGAVLRKDVVPAPVRFARGAIVDFEVTI